MADAKDDLMFSKSNLITLGLAVLAAVATTASGTATTDTKLGVQERQNADQEIRLRILEQKFDTKLAEILTEMRHQTQAIQDLKGRK